MMENSINVVESAKMKAKKLLNSYVAVIRTNFIYIGRLVEAKIEKLWSMKIPFCRLRIKDMYKFSIDGKKISYIPEDFVYINAPEHIFPVNELKYLNRKVYEAWRSCKEGGM